MQKPSRLEATSAAQAGGPYGKAPEAAAGGDGSRLLHPVAGRKGAEEGLNPSCLTQIFCSAMPWVDCTRLRYHCTKLPDVNLCPQVGFEGRKREVGEQSKLTHVRCSTDDFMKLSTPANPIQGTKLSCHCRWARCSRRLSSEGQV